MQVDLPSIFSEIDRLSPKSAALILRNFDSWIEREDGEDVTRYKLEPGAEKFSVLLGNEGIQRLPIGATDLEKNVQELLQCEICIVTGEPYYSLLPIAKSVRDHGYSGPIFLEITSDEAENPKHALTAVKQAKQYSAVDLLSRFVYLTKTRKSPRMINFPIDDTPDVVREDPTPLPLFEGRVRSTLLTRAERNPVAHGYDCAVCGYNFTATFCEAAEGFIHVHHLNPLANSSGQRKVDPKEDLRPVCPNCHFFIHSRKPMYPINEVKKLLKNRNQ